MKTHKRIISVALAALVFGVFPMQVVADSVEDLKQQEAQVADDGQQLSQEIQSALSEVNQKYQEIENLKSDIAEAGEQILSIEDQISQTETSIERRREVVADRMRDLQVNGGSSKRFLQAVLNAESLSDLVNIAFAVNTVQTAENEKIQKLEDDKVKLSELKVTLDTTKATLEANEASLATEADILDTEVANLKEKLQDNQELLATLINSRQQEETRIAEEAEQARLAAEASANQSTVASSSEAETTTSESAGTTDTGGTTPTAPVPQTPTPAPSTTTGNTISVVATAYSTSQTGMGTVTALGIDLTTNPWVVAVDPSVIPLGSMVVVDGYGYAIAGDTGGDIVGNRVDVHYPTVEACKQWGRRTVNLTIQ